MVTAAAAHAARRAQLARFIAARHEDLTFLADHGVGTEEAAHRVGTTLAGLEKWCRDHDADLWRRLRTNDETAATIGAGARLGRARVSIT